MTTLEILQKTRELLSDQAHWTACFFARDKRGHQVPWASTEAICWCVSGALRRAAWVGHSTVATNWDIVRDLERKFYDTLEIANRHARVLFSSQLPHMSYDRINVIAVNDRLGYDAVMQVLDAAIVDCQTQGNA